METSEFEFANRWIAFFDILGFRRLVSNSKTSLDLYRILYNYTDTLSYLREECSGYKEGSLAPDNIKPKYERTIQHLNDTIDLSKTI